MPDSPPPAVQINTPDPAPGGLKDAAKIEILQHLEVALDQALERMAGHQRQRVLHRAGELNPRLTGDDVLQPQDFPELRCDPEWNYEDGVLAGILAAQIAVRSALRRDPLSSFSPAALRR